jgi:hypothetical protein
MNFNQFLFAWREGTLWSDAAWRAYDIPAVVKRRHAKYALKALGLAYAGELAISHFMALYEVPSRQDAQAVLGSWWLWSQIDRGRHPRVPLRKARTGPVAGGGPLP